jgi:DNA modification methylase
LRKEVIGNATLYLGDCLTVLPRLGKVDAVITDPPYGIGKPIFRENQSRVGKNARRKDHGHDANIWDIKPPKALFESLLAMSRHQIIWGGNYFELPISSGWLVWDKMNAGSRFADCELAWTNLPRAARLFRHMWHGLCRETEVGQHLHPTQKAVAVMTWCLSFVEDAETVLDPFMGSGTTGVACANAKKSFIGIEAHEPFFDISCQRIENAQRQERLFA